MGFSIEQAKRALRKSDDNLEQAINFVLEHGNESDSVDCASEKSQSESKVENEIPEFFRSDFNTASLHQIMR